MDSIIYAAGVVALSIPVVVVGVAVAWLLYRTTIATVDVITQLILAKKRNAKRTCSIRFAWFCSFESAKWSEIARRIRTIFTN